MPATAASISTASTARPRAQPRGSGRYQARASGITISAPAASPSHQVRATSGSSLAADHVAGPQRQRTDGRADRRGGGDRGAQAADAAEAVQRRAARDQSADQQRRHEHLEHVPERLPERRPQRQRRVVVGEQIADQHPGPEAQPTEAQERRSPPRPEATRWRRRDRRTPARSRPSPPRSRQRPTRRRRPRSDRVPPTSPERARRARGPAARRPRHQARSPRRQPQPQAPCTPAPMRTDSSPPIRHGERHRTPSQRSLRGRALLRRGVIRH